MSSHAVDRRPLRRAPRLLALALLGLAPAGAEESGPDPWQVLKAVATSLTSSPRSATFVQIYHPAGFSSGEQENGTLAFSLPSCLRWDYESPYGKTFLLDDDIAYSWNWGDSSGRRFRLTSRDEPGLDLLRLRVEELRPRYAARAERLANGSFEVILTPRTPGRDLTEARMTVDRELDLLLALGYRDLEGNTTRFEISAYRPLSDLDRCTPPATMQWLDE